MLTLGSKVFFGGAVVAALCAFGYASFSSDQVGVVLLLGAILALATLGCAVIFGAGATDRFSYEGQGDPRPSRYPNHTITPIVAALSAGATVIGFAMGAPFLLMGFASLLVCAAVWFSEAWRDHPDYVRKLTARASGSVGLPFGMPVAGLALIGLVAISVSRTFLAVSHTMAWIIAAVVAVVAFIGAIALAAGPRLSRTTRNVVAATAAIAILGMGAYGIVVGRHSAEHEEGHGEGHSTEKIVEEESK